MRICRDCGHFQNGICTEDGSFADDGGTCDRWKYRYEPLVFAVSRMRKAQKLKAQDWKSLQNRQECEKKVDEMLRQIDETGEIS